MKTTRVTGLFILILYLFSFQPDSLYSQKIKITKIIDTNLFEINKQDTVKLANLEIPSKTTNDSLLKKNFIPYVLKYENEKLLRKHFIIEYVNKSDNLQTVPSVYLYEKHPLSKDLINDDFLRKGYAKYIPVKESDEQKECEEAAVKAQKEKRGIWNPGWYFRSDPGMRAISFHYGQGELGDDNNYNMFMLSFQNEQNRTFSAKLQLAYYRHIYYDYEGVGYFDGNYYGPIEKVSNDLLLTIDLNANSKYLGLKFPMRLYYSSLGKKSGFNFIPFLPSIGINFGKIRTIYGSITVLPNSNARLYELGLSAHYFLPSPFWAIHLYYYFNLKNNDDNKEIRLKLEFNLKNKLYFSLNVSKATGFDYSPSRNYYLFDLGVGYIY